MFPANKFSFFQETNFITTIFAKSANSESLIFQGCRKKSICKNESERATLKGSETYQKNSGQETLLKDYKAWNILHLWVRPQVPQEGEVIPHFTFNYHN